MPRAALGVATCFLSLCLGSTAAQPKTEKQITDAVEKGVAFLRSTQTADGWWFHHGPHGTNKENRERNVGATALCGLALVLADVPPDDPGIKKAAIVVRTHAKGLTNTYAICCCILFLDRINKGYEDGMIRMLGDKLLRGQDRQTAGWEYHCPLKNHASIDNSCTQFALLGLWTARRYNLKVDNSLRYAEARFRLMQQADGGWFYREGAGGHLGATSLGMTCAGLMAIAFGMATRGSNEASFEGGKAANSTDKSSTPSAGPPPDPRKDAAVLKGKEFIKQIVAKPNFGGPHLAYSLWALERVCLIYSYHTLDKIDWYTWGVTQLLQHQQKDGGWNGDSASGRNAEAAFALLFLRKADLAGLVLEASFSGGNLKGLKPAPGTGGDSGNQERPLPKAEPGREGMPGEAAFLQEELLKARGSRLDQILELLEVTKGSEYTTALVDALGQLRGEAREKTRTALSRRLSRMTAKTLREYLKHPNVDCRIAAVQAAGLKDEKELIPELLPLLKHRDIDLQEAAYLALKKLSGRDYGRNNADAWQQWWDSRKK